MCIDDEMDALGGVDMENSHTFWTFVNVYVYHIATSRVHYELILVHMHTHTFILFRTHSELITQREDRCVLFRGRHDAEWSVTKKMRLAYWEDMSDWGGLNYELGVDTRVVVNPDTGQIKTFVKVKW
jgi:hypothetical protein